MTYLILTYETSRRNTVCKRRIPKPLLVALHIICLGRIRRLDPDNVESTAWEHVIVDVAKQWCISVDSAHAYFYSKRYSSSLAFGLTEQFLELPGIGLYQVLAAVERHLPCNRHRPDELPASGYCFNLCRPCIRPRWRPSRRQIARTDLSSVGEIAPTYLSDTASAETGEGVDRAEPQQ